MCLTLESITFMKGRLWDVPVVFKPSDGTDRRQIEPPEWPPCRKNDCLSPVVFPLCFTGGSRDFIFPVVTICSRQPGTFQIRATPPKDYPNIMGSALTDPVTFSPGNLRIEDLAAKLDAPLLQDWSRHRVGFHTDQWMWEFCPAGGADWREFQRTSHQVYTILAPPRNPWTFRPQAACDLWLEVVDQACKWAKGARSAKEAADQITKEIFNLGEEGSAAPLVWNGDANYSKGGQFDCEGFLRYFLKKELGQGSAVNCSDLACIVTTFANALGAHLLQSTIGPHFDTNCVRLIGMPEFGPTDFERHEVAWDGGAGIGDPLWDACLVFPGEAETRADSDDQADGPDEPPLGMTFGGSQGAYADRLIAGKQQAGPQGPITDNNGGNRPVTIKNVTNSDGLRSTAKLAGVLPSDLDYKLAVIRYCPQPRDMQGYQIIGWQHQDTTDGPTAYVSVWGEAGNVLRHRVKVTTVPLPSPDRALSYLAVEVGRSPVPLRRVSGPGVTFETGDGTWTLTLAGNLYVSVSSAGVSPMDVRPFAAGIAASLRDSSSGKLHPLMPVPKDGLHIEKLLADVGASELDSVAIRPTAPVVIQNRVIQISGSEGGDATVMVRPSGLTSSTELQ